ncbi:MAG: PAS domain S-box protein [Gammaproteobacteria bacterium]|nr:PAS domain S-box protein [Gammaproteobacteria bacterium]
MRSRSLQNSSDTELQRLRKILDSAGDGFIMHDLMGNIVDANDALCRELGYSLEELQNMTVADIDQDAAKDLDGMWDNLHKSHSTVVAYGQLKSKDGRTFPVEIKLYAVEDEGAQYVCAFLRDISDRTIKEERINFTQFAIDNASDAAFWVDVATKKFMYVNRRAREYLDYTEEEFLEMGIPDIDVQFSKDVWPIFVENLKKIKEDTFESELVKKSGCLIPVEITTSYMEYGGKSYVVAFIREISERRKTEAELLEAKERAEQASQAKSEFLTAMSHELKTPLNAIIGYSEMLTVDFSDELSVEQMHCSNSINKAGLHLLGLIDDVLDLASIESGKVELSFERVNLCEILEHCLAITRLMAQKRGVSVHVSSVSKENAIVWADRTKLTQVVLNLISNAIKYNRKNGSVEIECSQHDNMVRVSIRDTGYGIPENRRDALFSHFNRLGKENSEIEGTGVGLVICRSLVELMGGEIGLESETDQGSCFYFTVPVYESTN